VFGSSFVMDHLHGPNLHAVCRNVARLGDIATYDVRSQKFVSIFRFSKILKYSKIFKF